MTNPAILNLASRAGLTAAPVWTCTADVQQRTDFPVFAKAVFMFTDDSTPQRSYTYTEERVSDPSDVAIQKLARDHVAQLQRMDALALAPISGAVDLTPPVVADPDPDAVALADKQAQYADLIRQRVQHKNAVDLGILPADDASVSGVIDQLQKAAADPTESAILLGLLG